MAEWPISTSKAAKRLGIPFAVASVLIRTHGIETVSSESGTKFNGLMPESYERLRGYAKPFQAGVREGVALSA